MKTNPVKIDPDMYTDSNGLTLVTRRRREVNFIRGLEANGIPWQWHSAPTATENYCPSVRLENGLQENDVYRFTQVDLLHVDSSGEVSIVYTG